MAKFYVSFHGSLRNAIANKWLTELAKPDFKWLYNIILVFKHNTQNGLWGVINKSENLHGIYDITLNLMI